MHGSAKYRYVILDSYNHRTKEIVSRKYTQLGEISEETAIGYLKELADNYAPGSIIANVPSNTNGRNMGIFEKNKGTKIRGQMYLEVPVQQKPIPKSVLDYARLRNIKIRDVNNKIYNQ